MSTEKKYQFAPFTYPGTTEPSFTRITDGDRLVGILRRPGHYIGERPDYHRVDCNNNDYEPVLNPGLKLAIQQHLGDERVSVRTQADWKWNTR